MALTQLFDIDDTPTLFKMGKFPSSGLPYGRAVLELMIGGVIAFYGVEVHPSQIEEAAELAYQEYSHLTVAEWKYFINRIKTGRYRSHKNFTPALFMETLGEYTYEVAETKGEYNAYRWQQNEVEMVIDPATGQPGVPVSDELFSAMINQLTETMTAEKNKEYEEKQAKRKQAIEEGQERMRKMGLIIEVKEVPKDKDI